MSERITPKQAREQAAEAKGFLASKEIWIGDECFEIPNRGLLDEDQLERLNELELEVETWDHHPDVEIPERRLKDKDGNETAVYPARTESGLLITPHRKNGKPIKPSYQVRVAIALWGKEKYERYKAGGGFPTDVTAVLSQLDEKIKERESSDPKSVDSAGGVESVADGD